MSIILQIIEKIKNQIKEQYLRIIWIIKIYKILNYRFLHNNSQFMFSSQLLPFQETSKQPRSILQRRGWGQSKQVSAASHYS